MLSSNRRDFCRTLLTGAVGLSLARTAFAQGAPHTFAATDLGGNLHLISGAGSNVVVLAQPDGLLLVNGGGAEHASSLLAFLGRQFSGRPVKVLFNTDWHRENTGLNEAVGRAGAAIVAHENTKLWMDTDVYVRWQDRKYKPVPKAALPTETFYTTGTRTFGGESISYGHLGQAHTDGDIYVHFPGPNVLVAGDVVTVGSYPVLDYSTGGWITGIWSGVRTLLGVGSAETRVVPGAGAVQPRAHLQAEYDMLTATRDRLVKLLKSGLSLEEVVAARPTKDFDAVWGDPDLFVRNAYPGMWGHVRELGGVI